MAWTVAALLPGLWVAAILAMLGLVLRRVFDPVPLAAWALLALLLAVLFAPVLIGGRVLLPLGYLEHVAPFASQRLDDPSLEAKVGLQGDLVLQIAPWSMRVRAAYADGEWPLWNPYAGAGVPLWSNPQAQSLQALQLLSLMFPVARAAGILAALRVSTALLFTVLFLRRAGLGETAALAGGSIFALGGYLQGWLGWPLATTACVLPLLLYAWLRVEQEGGRRDRLLLGAALFGLATAGHPETALYAVGLLLVFALARAFRRTWPERWRLLRASAGAALLAGSLAAPLLLPATRALAVSQRAAQLEARHARVQALPALVDPRDGERPWPAVARRLAALVAPLASGDNLRGAYWGNRNVINDTAGFTGTAAWLLFLLALCPPRSREGEQVWLTGRRVLVAAVGVAVLVIARPPGLVRVFDLLPVLRASASFHSRISLWLDFGVAVLAALALERWRRTPAVSPSRRAVVVLAMALGGAIVASYAWLDRPELSTVRQLAFGGQLLALALAAACLGWAPPSARRAAGAVIFVALLVEPLALRWKSNTSAPAGAFYPASPPLRYLADHLRPGERMVGFGGALRANMPTVYELADPRLNDPARPAEYLEALAAIQRRTAPGPDELAHPGSPLYGLLGVRFALVPPEVALPPPFRLAQAFDAARVYERPDALPLLFWPARAEPCPPERQWTECTRDIADFCRLAMVRDERAAPLPWSESGAVLPAVFALETTRVAARLATDEPRWLATSIYQDGGWRLLVDGNRVATALANGPFLAAWLPAGEHAVDLVYRPPGFLAGMLVAACGLGVVMAWAARPRNRARSHATIVPSA